MERWGALVWLILQLCVLSSQRQLEIIQCNEEGYFRHPSDCRKFYICTNFNGTRKSLSIFHFTCPEFTAFDDILDVCVWPLDARPPCKFGGDFNSETGAPDIGTISDVSTGIKETSYGGEETPNQEGPLLHFQSSNAAAKPTIDWNSIKPPDNERNPNYSQTSSDHSSDAPDLGRNLLPSDDSSQTSSMTDLFKDSSKSRRRTENRQSIVCTCNAKPNRQHAESRVIQITTSNVTLPTSIKCKEEGYFRDPNNCRIFYVCTKFNGTRRFFSIFHFICPEYTAFDDILDVCVWPRDARPPCNETDLTFSETASDVGASSKEFTKLESSSGREETAKKEGTPLHFKSSDEALKPTGTQLLIDTYSTTPPSNERNSKYSQIPTGDVSTTLPQLGRNLPSDESSESSFVNGLFKDDSESRVSTEDGIKHIDNVKPNIPYVKSGSRHITTSGSREAAPIECKEEGYFRHPYDCRRFYVCTKFHRARKYFTIFHFICPEHTAFDDILNVCVWPSGARPPCKGRDSTFSKVEATDIKSNSA